MRGGRWAVPASVQVGDDIGCADGPAGRLGGAQPREDQIIRIRGDEVAPVPAFRAVIHADGLDAVGRDGAWRGGSGGLSVGDEYVLCPWIRLASYSIDIMSR